MVYGKCVSYMDRGKEKEIYVQFLTALPRLRLLYIYTFIDGAQ